MMEDKMWKFFVILFILLGSFYILATLVAKYAWEDYCENKGYSTYECLLAESNPYLEKEIVLREPKDRKERP